MYISERDNCFKCSSAAKILASFFQQCCYNIDECEHFQILLHNECIAMRSAICGKTCHYNIIHEIIIVFKFRLVFYAFTFPLSTTTTALTFSLSLFSFQTCQEDVYSMKITPIHHFSLTYHLMRAVLTHYIYSGVAD